MRFKRLSLKHTDIVEKIHIGEHNEVRLKITTENNQSNYD